MTRPLAPLALLALALVPAAVHADERPFVYAVDAVGPNAAEVDATYSVNVGARPSGAVRFIDPTVGREGVVQQITAQVGATDWLAIGAFGLLAVAPGSNPVGTGGGYLHFTALRPRAEDRGGTLGFTLLGLREFEGAGALSLFVDGGYRRSGFEFVGNAQFERRLARGADGIDLIARFAANYDVLRHRPEALRVGTEYVGQDLEDYFEEEEAEGGAVHLLAASLSATLLDRKLHLGLAPGLVMRVGERGFGGRLTVGYTF